MVKFIILTLLLLFVRYSFSQSLAIQFDSNLGFYIETYQINCHFVKNETKYFIPSKDTIINFEKDTKYVNLVIWDHGQNFYMYIPLVFNYDTLLLKCSNADLGVNEIEKLNSFQLFGSMQAENYFEYYKICKLKILSNLIVPDSLRNLYLGDLFNPYTFYLFQSTLNERFTIESIKDSIKSICPGILFLINNFRELDSLENYSQHYLEMDHFFNDLKVNSTSVLNVNNEIRPTSEGNIYFWGSWCAPCIEELKNLSPEEKSNPNNYFISLDKDSVKCKKAALEIGLNINVFITTNNWLRNYQIELIPAIIYYDYDKQKIKKIK